MSHEAAFYQGPAGYLPAVLPFVRDGVAKAEPVLVAVPGDGEQLVRAALDGEPARVAFADMARLGVNPGRIIAAIWDFAERHAGARVRFVSELIWAGRSAAAIREAAAHEAMINIAFAGTPVAVLCPYDTGALSAEIVASAARTHPVIRDTEYSQPSSDYSAEHVLADVGRPLGPPPAHAECLAYTANLREVRAVVARYARRARLGEDRTADLVLAAGEVAANTVRHTTAGGILEIWHTDAEIICQVTDQGLIRDPLVGRRRPPGASGLGLWVVNQLCDLVELRTGPRGTAVRMHVSLGR